VTAPPPASVGTSPPRRADGVELLGELGGSGYESTRSLVRRADGQTLQLTPLLYALLAEVDGRRGPAELAEVLSARIGKTAAAEDVEHLLGKLEPLGVLHDVDGAEPVLQKSNPLLALRLKVVVSDPAVTRRLTTPFTWLFRPWVVVPVLLAFVGVCWFVLVEKGLASATHQAFDRPGLLLAVFALTVVSAGFHEFGHAAGCRYGGATPGAMGAGLYLVWPAFYTDVDDSYRLPRRGRLIVDLGGLYFNALVAVAVMVAWLMTRQDALLLGVATQLLQMVRQLAPVIRADGYHVLADLTGVPDLFAHMKPTLLGALPQNWGKPSPLRRGARVIVTAWVLVVVPLLLSMFATAVLLLPRMAATAWTSGGKQLDLLAASFSSGDPVPVLARLLSLLALAVPVAATTYLLVRVTRSTARNGWTATQDRPPARAAFLLGAGLLLALLAWAWWPDGQYRPVSNQERGTIADVFRASPAVQPARLSARAQPAMALIPRTAGAPVLLVVRPESGGPAQAILTTNPDKAGEPTTAQVAPFDLPDGVRPGGNQAVAVNTKDGAVVYDVAVALVKVVDGAPVTNRNEAYALASCRRCATVAVAFQVVLVIGQSNVQVPVNAAVAGNRDCVQCLTAALAVQLVVSLEALPSEQVEAELQQAWSRLQGLEQLTAELDVAEVYATVKSVQAEVLAVLQRNGLVEAVPSAQPSGAPSSMATSVATAAATAEPSVAPSVEATSAPSSEPSTVPSPAEASPAAESPQPEQTAAASPSP
jgi:putative peptide zinc metalloprotease protein